LKYSSIQLFVFGVGILILCVKRLIM